MEDKQYKICDYFKDDFEDKVAIENYKGVVYDQALDIIDQMFSSPDWKVNSNGDFSISFRPYQIDNNSESMNKKPIKVSHYLRSVIENILRNLGIDDIDCTRCSCKFKVTLSLDVLKNILRKYYGILQEKEYNKETLNGEYSYDNDLNQLANGIIEDFFDIAQKNPCNGLMSMSVINHMNNVFHRDLPELQIVDLSDEDFDLFIKLIENKLNSISSEDITLKKESFIEFSISCPDVSYNSFKRIYNEQKASHNMLMLKRK